MVFHRLESMYIYKVLKKCYLNQEVNAESNEKVSYKTVESKHEKQNK